MNPIFSDEYLIYRDLFFGGGARYLETFKMNSSDYPNVTVVGSISFHERILVEGDMYFT